MNAKKAKLLRKYANSIAADQNLPDKQTEKRHHSQAQYGNSVHPTSTTYYDKCAKSIYRDLKKKYKSRSFTIASA